MTANTPFDRDESIRISRSLYDIAKRLNNDRLSLMENFAWVETDARITGFGKFHNSILGAALGIKFYTDCLIQGSWWDVNSSDYSTEDRKRVNGAYIDFQKIGLVQLGFSAFESTIRALLREIDSNAVNGATGPFKQVYECMLRSKLSLNDQWCYLLDLWREVRNTIHNNGVYFSRNQSSCLVTYNGVQYNFHHGQKTNFVHWDFLIMILSDGRELMNEIVNHPQIVGISGTIKDPYA